MLERLGLARDVRRVSGRGGRARALREPAHGYADPRPAIRAEPPDGPPDFIARLGQVPHDLRDPDPWLALHLDPSLPFDPQAKAALILDARSFSRRFVLPLVRPFARTHASCWWRCSACWCRGRWPARACCTG